MPKFKCVNENCSEFGKEVFFVKLNYRFDKEKGELVTSEDLSCKVCGSELVQNKKKGYPQLMKFNSLSEQEKKKVISKRAQDHFEKVGKEQKYNIKKEIIKRNLRDE